MQDEINHEYPDPGANHQEPYPSISQDASGNTLEQLSGFDGPSSQASQATVSEFHPRRGYITLSQYFEVGNASIVRASRQETVDNAGYETEREIGTQSSAHEILNPVIFHDLPEVVRPDSGATQVDEGTEESGSPSTRGQRGPSERPTRGRGSRGRGRGGWKRALRGTEHANLFKTPRLSKTAGDTRGRGRPRGRGMKSGGAKNHIDPGNEFRKTLTQGTDAYMIQDYEAAADFALQAIQLNPEVYQAHSLLSDALRAQGKEREALVAKTLGAVTQRDGKLWVEIAERWQELEGDERPPDDIDSAIWCYRQAIYLEKTKYEYRKAQVTLYLEREEYARARVLSKGMLSFQPDDLENVRQYAELCYMFDNTEVEKARAAYEEAFRLHMAKNEPLNHDSLWSNINVYLDLLGRLDKILDAPYNLKRLARWVLGRQDEYFWDRYGEDDREFDSTNERRAYSWEFQRGLASRDLTTYGDGLPIELRVKLGLFRLKLGPAYYAEASKHFEHLLRLKDEAELFHDLFMLVGDGLRACRMLEAAITFYEPIKIMSEMLDHQFWMKLADCYRAVKRYEDAEECYLIVVESNDNDVESRVQLAKIYEALGMPKKAMPLANEVIRLSQAGGKRGDYNKMGRPQKGEERDIRSAKLHNNNVATVPAALAAKPDALGKEGVYGQWQLDAHSRVAASVARSGVTGDHPGNETNLVSQDNEERFADVESEDSGDDNVSGEPNLVVTGQRGSAPREAKGKPSAIWLQQQASRIHGHHLIVRDLWPTVEADEDEDAIKVWMQHANAMVGELRSTKKFYPRDRPQKTRRVAKKTVTGRAAKDMEALKKRLHEAIDKDDDDDEDDDDDDENDDDDDLRLSSPETEDNMPRDFHDITFAEWHHIMADLALLYAKYADQEKCYDLLQVGMKRASAFRFDPELRNTTCALCICCALKFNDGKLLGDSARQLIFQSNHRGPMAYQVLAATGRLTYGEHPFKDGALQKFTLRSLRMHDYVAMPPEMRSKWNWGGNTGLYEDRANRLGEVDDALDPGVLTIYGHMLGSSRKAMHGGNSLSYLFRALALQPDNLVVNLSIAAMFVVNAMKQKTDNRQYGIAQGLSFLYRYYDLRVESGKACHVQEAEFNVARIFHLLGLTHLAVPAYEKVLNLSEDVQREHVEAETADGDEAEDFAKEAAFALQNMFALAGNQEAARAITERWLVL